MQLVQDQSAAAPSALDPMSAAIQKARASIGDFFRAHRIPRARQTDFRIQAIFHDGNSREQIWLSHLDFNTRPATGIVCTRTSLKTISYGKRVPFHPDQMSDWMYLDNGQLIGGFTIPVQVNPAVQQRSFLDRIKRRLVA